MGDAFPWLRVLAAVLAYVAVALIASRVTRWMGADLKAMGSRTSRKIVLVGVIANLLLVGVVVLMVVLVDHRSPPALGLSVSVRDGPVDAAGALLLAAVTVGFLWLLADKRQVRIRRRAIRPAAAGGFSGVLLVLFAVALAEEVLFRGYVTLNLLDSGPLTLAVTSIVVFTAVHALTNRVSAAQLASWALGGGTLLCAYLLSGSLWVAVVLHLLIDVTNVVGLGIAGRYSLVTLSPSPTDRDRAWYRLVTTVVLVALLVGAYGPTIKVG